MLSLEPTDDLANPAFKDAVSCKKWLSQLQFTNLSLAQGMLHKQLDELNRCPLSGIDRLQTMEFLRETVSLVQSDIAKKLFGKKLPLPDDEFKLLIALSGLWQNMLTGYLRCQQMAEVGDKQLAAEITLLCQRSLFYGSLQVEEFFHAGYEPDPLSWEKLHAIYTHIETLGLQHEKVRDDKYQSGLAISCCTLYAKTLLMHRARLLGLSRAQWSIAELWLCNWGDALSIEPQCSMTKDDAPPLTVDLDGKLALQSIRHAHDASSVRYLALVPLSKQIRVKTILLQQGQTPQQAELGGDLSSKECIDLLNKLHACWCEKREDSLAENPRESPSLFLCLGIEQIYAQIEQKPFRPIKDSSTVDKDSQRQIETFGRVLDDTGRHELFELGFVPEEWLVDEDGLVRGRLLRKNPEGERLGLHQMISVFKPDSSNHKLGVIDFVRVTLHGHLYIGLHFLPGQPQPLIVRGNANSDTLQSGSVAALMLPALEKLRIPASLVIPRDWFQADRTLELNLSNHTRQIVTLGFSVEKGKDFERVSFKVAETQVSID